MATTTSGDLTLLRPAIHVQPSSNNSSATSSPQLNSLAALSRNTSVISSSSSSSSSSSLVAPPPPSRPRPLRSFSSQQNSYYNNHAPNGRARSPHTPTSPRAPGYLQHHFENSTDSPTLLAAPKTPTQPANFGTGLNPGTATPTGPRSPNRSRSNSAVRGARVHSPDDFEFGDILGEGSYSTVVSATHRRTSQVFALKILSKHHLQRVNKVKYAYVEKDSLARLSAVGHPGVVRLHWAFSDATSLYFVLDKADNGELMTKINTLGSLSIKCAQYYTAQIVDAVCWMHSLGILHRDMKPENVLLDSEMRVKITDFGTAKILAVNDDEMRQGSFVGSPGYISPELLITYTGGKSSDLWAIGCILFQCIAGVQPFKALTSYLSMEKTKHVDYVFPAGFDSVARDLVENLLVLDPTERLGHPNRGGVPALRAHAFFQDVGWETLWTGPVPATEAGLVKRELKQVVEGDEEGGDDVGAAWDALVKDLSEDEMDPADDETVDDDSPESSEVQLHAFPATTDAGPPLIPLLPHMIMGPQEKRQSWGSDESSGSEAGVSLPRGRRTSQRHEVIARDTHYPLVAVPNGKSIALSSSAPASYAPIVEGVSEDVPVRMRKMSVPTVVEEEGVGTSLVEGSATASSSSASSDGRLPPVKWASLLGPNEHALFSSPIRTRRKSIIPTRMKPRILVLTDLPRLLCLKEGSPPRSMSRVRRPSTAGSVEVASARVRVKSELVFENDKDVDARLVGSMSWNQGTELAAAAAAVVTGDGPSPISPVNPPPTGLRGRASFSSRTRAPRSRTLSGSAVDGNIGLLKGVEGKGERSFVIQTDGKVYTYIADDAALAARWVREIKGAPANARALGKPPGSP